VVPRLGILLGVVDHHLKVSLGSCPYLVIKMFKKIIIIIFSRFRQGSASLFQITLHKNLNAYHRIKGVTNHASIKVTPAKEIVYVAPSASYVN